MTYQQALARQLWDNAPCRVVKIEQLPDKYRLTRRDGLQVSVPLEFGRERKWLALCAREGACPSLSENCSSSRLAFD